MKKHQAVSTLFLTITVMTMVQMLLFLNLSQRVVVWKRSAALFLLSVKEKHQNSQKAVDFAVGQVQQMVSYAVQDKTDSALTMLQEHSLATGYELPDIANCFEVPDPFASLQTEYMQTKY